MKKRISLIVNDAIKEYDNIGEALFSLSEYRKGGNKDQAEIILSGDIFIDTPISIGNGNLDNLTIRGEKGARIIGGMRAPKLRPDTFEGKPCLSAYIPEVLEDKLAFSDLYVNGRRATPNRYPKNTKLRAVTTEFPNAVGLGDGSKWFIACKEDLACVKNIENAVVSFCHFWVDEHTPVESYDTETGKLTMKYRSRFKMTADYERNSTSEFYYYLENVNAGFGDPGDWYLSVPEATLYYVPLEGETPDNLEIFIPLTKQLITVFGDENKPAENVKIENVTFLCSMGDYASVPVGVIKDGNPLEPKASDAQSVCGGYGALAFRFAKNSSIRNCSFSLLGLHAVEIGIGCSDITVKANEMKHLGGGGVKIFGGKASDPPYFKTSKCIISENSISYISERYAAACGILACHTSENRITSNEVSYTGYTGISVGWVWGYGESSSYKNLIENNHVHHIGVGVLSDMSGIYTLGVQDGTVVRGNFVHDVISAHYGGHGIYADEGTSNVLFENNTVIKCNSNCFYQNYGKNNVVRNNIFAFSGSGNVAYGKPEDHVGAIFENNILITDEAPLYHSYNPQLGCSIKTVRSDNNVISSVSDAPLIFYSSKDGGTERQLNFTEWQNDFGMDKSSRILDKEALFKNHPELEKKISSVLAR